MSDRGAGLDAGTCAQCRRRREEHKTRDGILREDEILLTCESVQVYIMAVRRWGGVG